MSPVPFDSESVGHLSRPLRRFRNTFFELKTVFVMARRNFKVYDHIVFTRRSPCRYVVILDTGAGSNNTHKDFLAQTQ